MSSDPIGGYILFPAALARADLIAVTLKAMELAPDEFEVRLPEEDGTPLIPEEGFPFRTEEPPERALALLAQEKGGVIQGRASKGAEIFWFEPTIASYQPIDVWVDPIAMYYERDPEWVDLFAKRWLQLCEQGQAVFGYFCPFFFMFERDYLQEKILPVFQNGTVRDILEEIEPSWLVFLGSELAERWRQEQSPLYTPLLDSQDLPSGAHFFRISLGVQEAALSTLRSYP
jgi:hypothetical protein